MSEFESVLASVFCLEPLDFGFGLSGLKEADLVHDAEIDSFLLDDTEPETKCRSCSKQALYGCSFHNPISCKTHKHSWEKLTEQLCQSPECTAESITSKIGLVFCKKHNKPSDLITDTESNKAICEFDSCKRVVGPESKRCDCHPIPKTCGFKDCKNAATVGTFRKFRHCFDHKTTNDVLLNRPLCKADNCSDVASFGEWEDPVPIFCKVHRSWTHHDLFSRRCEIPECFNQSVYAFPGKRPYRCPTHALRGMLHISENRAKRPRSES